MTLLNTTPFFLLPRAPLGWGWAGVLCVVLLYFLWRWRRYYVRMNGRRWAIALVLLLSVPLTALFAGVHVRLGVELPPPDLPMDPILPVMMIFSALPWFFAARLLGTPWAILIGGLTGLILGSWNTHSIYTPLETALLAAVLSAALRQPYRTWGYRLVRNPLAAAGFVSALYLPLFLVDQTMSICSSISYGTLINSMDYAATQAPASAVAFCGPILVAGICAFLLMRIKPRAWGLDECNKPSPLESSLEVRFLYTLGPMYALLILTLLVGVWMIVSNVSQQMLLDRLESTASVTADSVPFYLQTGQNMIHQLALDERFLSSDTSGPDRQNPAVSHGLLKAILQEKMNILPFFDGLTYLDKNGIVLASTFQPAEEFNLYPEELSGARLALHGVAVQSYAIPAEKGGQSARVSFLAAVQDQQNRVHGVLLGRSEIASNPLLEPVINGLNALNQIDGVGYLLDEDNRILYQSSGKSGTTRFPSLSAGETRKLVEKSGEDGTRRIYFSVPVTGREWTIVLTVPAAYPQWIALRMVMLFFGFLLAAAFLTWRIMQYIVQKVTKSLKAFAVQADRIAEGELDYAGITLSSAADEANEIGDLRRSFEKMRQGLKSRLEELNRLLIVSQQVASTLEIDKVIYPILDSALRSGASSARVVLARFSPYGGNEGEDGGLVYFGTGKSSEQYQYLDDQIYDLTRIQELILLTNVPRASLLHFSSQPSGLAVSPQALIAVALRHENVYLGTFWVGFDQSRPLTQDDEDVRFLITLASQTAVAAANSRLYLTSELGRQRLAAILEATPDPVLVTDEEGLLLLANPAARQVLGDQVPVLSPASVEAPTQITHFSKVIEQPELVRLVLHAAEETESAEIRLPDDRVYLATASTISVDGRLNGRVCVMQDVTRFKELDTMKSDFVSTVSHDLRSPLTLIHGYVTMLEMVGDLNEQQMNYIHRISASIDKMGHLINNLLDLGRIESGIALHLESIAVREMIDQVVSAFQMPAQQKQIQFSTLIQKISPDMEIEVDVSLIQQALHNLVENAIKFTEPFGEVRLEADLRDNEVVFAVIDTGIGIAPVDQVRLYEKFYRAGWHTGLGGERGKEPGSHKPGTGLGLAIVKSIAERHNGRVWVDSQLGKGSSFFFAVPLRQAE